MVRGGVFAYVPSGVDALVPVWVAHAASGDGAAVFPATVIVLDEAASLTVIDAYASAPGTNAIFSDATVALVAGRDSRISYIALQQWSEGAWHFATHRTS